MAAEFYRLSDPKKDFNEEITESYLAVYRRILKMILEQGCKVKMVSGEKMNSKIEKRFNEKINTLLFLGQILFELSESYAEQEMIEDATDISFDQEGLYIISRRHHYEDAFEKILGNPDRIINKGILNKTAEADFPTGASVQPKVGHWCLLVQAVCDRSMVQPKKIKPLIKSLFTTALT